MYICIIVHSCIRNILISDYILQPTLPCITVHHAYLHYNIYIHCMLVLQCMTLSQYIALCYTSLTTLHVLSHFGTDLCIRLQTYIGWLCCIIFHYIAYITFVYNLLHRSAVHYIAFAHLPQTSASITECTFVSIMQCKEPFYKIMYTQYHLHTTIILSYYCVFNYYYTINRRLYITEHVKQIYKYYTNIIHLLFPNQQFFWCPTPSSTSLPRLQKLCCRRHLPQTKSPKGIQTTVL